MSADWSEVAWPADRLGEVIEALGRRLRPDGHGLDGTSPPGLADESLGVWIEAAATWLGLVAEPVEVGYGEVDLLLAHSGPALIRLPGVAAPRFLALLGKAGSGRRRDRVAVL